MASHSRAIPVPAPEHEPERRIFPRWELRFEVRYGLAGDLTWGEGYEISEGGLVFAGLRRCPVLSVIDIGFQLDPRGEKEWFEVRARVRHVEGGRMGVQFLNLSLRDRMAILEAIKPLR